MGKTNVVDSKEKEFLLPAVSLNICIETVAGTAILQQFFFVKKILEKN